MIFCWFSDSPTSLSNYLACKQRGVTGAKRGAIKWAINRDVTFGEGKSLSLPKLFIIVGHHSVPD